MKPNSIGRYRRYIEHVVWSEVAKRPWFWAITHYPEKTESPNYVLVHGRSASKALAIKAADVALKRIIKRLVALLEVR